MNDYKVLDQSATNFGCTEPQGESPSTVAPKPPMRWFWFYVGPGSYMDVWGQISFGFMGRRDLMNRWRDEGRYILAVFEFELIFGPTRESIEDGNWRWVFWPRFRSDVDEIALRLAGGPE